MNDTLDPLKPDPTPEENAADIRERQLVSQWQEYINKAKDRCASDFDRMRADMQFVRGLQWEGQESLSDTRYVCNLVLRALKQSVALLYARNPECDVIQRDRLNFAIWDGNTDSLVRAQQALQVALASGKPVPPLVQALLEDYSRGEMQKDINSRIGKTVRILFQYMMDMPEAQFKLQMKQLVMRVKTTGVGYVKVNFENGFESQPLVSYAQVPNIATQLNSIMAVSKKADKGSGLKPESLEFEKARQLGNNVENELATEADQEVSQRISFDFLPSTSVIIDPRCRALKGFIGAHWLAVEYIYDLDYINEFFGTDIKPGDIKTTNSAGLDSQRLNFEPSNPQPKKTMCCVWEVYDKDTKTMFYMIDGLKKFLVKPSPVQPRISNFWPIVSLTFNDLEADNNSSNKENSIYPPSDVQLMRHSQKEWNRTRQALRQHRIANSPCYMAQKGVLTDADKEKIMNHEDSALIEIEGVSMGTPVNQLLVAFQHSAIVPQLYDTSVLTQDLQYTTGEQDASLGRPVARVTATGANIAEQAKNSVAASNVDDLDEFLSSIAQMGGEIILRYFDIENARRIAGPGAILPQTDRQDFLNAIILTTKAASAGRPNKAVNVSTFTQIAPFLIQAGANPLSVIEHGVRIMDENIDVSKFFPQAQMGLMTGAAITGQKQLAAQQSTPSTQLQQPVDIPEEQ